MKSPLNPLPFELKQDEHLLWSYTAENKPVPAGKRRSLWPLAILLLVLAVAGRAVEWLNISDEFSFLARTCMYLAVIVALVAKTERNTGRYEVYALTNQRAYIIELSTSKKHVPGSCCLLLCIRRWCTGYCTAQTATWTITWVLSR